LKSLFSRFVYIRVLFELWLSEYPKMKFTLKAKKRSAVSPVIATLLLIAIAVAAAIIVYAFVTGLIGGLSSGSGSNLYPTTATLVVPTGTSPGTLVITVLNSGNSPVTGIQVTLASGANVGVQDQDVATCMGEYPSGFSCVTNAAPVLTCPSAPAVGPPIVPAVFCTAANTLVDTLNPLSVGSQVSASVGVASHGTNALQAGSAYSFTVTIDTASGSAHTELVTATAEL
jgi:flagellin-like protein